MINVKNFLKSTFDMDVSNIQQIYGGMMNSSFLYSFENKNYIIYFPTDQANKMVDRHLEKCNQLLFYKSATTSKNIYFDEKSGIKINEYISGKSLDKIDDYDLQKIANLFKKVHNSPLLSQKNYSPFDKLETFKANLIEFNYQLDKQYKELENFLFKYKEFLTKQKLTLCHNDAQKSNIIRSNNDQYYLIDFEFAGNNDPIYDIATFGNGDVQEGYRLLYAYFLNPSQEEKLRYFLWRIYISLQWYVVAIYKDLSGEGLTHKIDFKNVARHFIENAEIAYKEASEIKL